MTESSKPNQNPSSKKSAANEPSQEALILTPISIARARHASSQGTSLVDKTRKVSADIKDQLTHTSDSGKVSQKTESSHSVFNGSGGCMLVSMLAVAFVIGGVLGGVMGGGMLIWANNSGVVAIAEDTPTPTPSPSATPAPAETATPVPSPTPKPANTPSIADVIESVIPSVVTVINQQDTNFPNPPNEGRVVGSGVIIDSRGYIATNNHVIDKPGEIKVMLSDGRETIAELIAANPAEDLAILKVNYIDLPTIEWGNSKQIRPGQVVYAIGSPLGDFPNSVSFGIVSGLNRALEIDRFVIDGLIQTDAAINRGSSGGPLISPDGTVIGINTFIIRESEERGVAEGIAFAIPAETAKNLLIPWIAAHTGESVPIPVSEESN